MANLPVIDATGGTVYVKATGAGTNGDPYIPLQGGGTVAVTGGIAGTVVVSAISAGNTNIGDVDVASIAAGDNNIGNVDIVTMPGIAGTVEISGTAAVRTTNNGTVSVSSIAAGNNNIGDVDIASMPAISGTVDIAGTVPIRSTNNGTVSVSNFPATQAISIAATVNTLEQGGTVAVSALPNVTIGAALPAGTNNIGDIDVLTLPAIPAGTNNIGTVGVSGTPPVFVANNGTVSVSAIAAGNNNIGDVDIASMPAISGTVVISGTVSTQERSGTVIAQLQPVTAGGLSVYRDITAGTAGTAFKTSAGQLYGYYLANTGAVPAYFKLYDKATAPGTADVPVMTLPLFGTAAANVAFPNGIAFANGIGIRVTTGAGDTDATAPAGTTAFVNLMYK